MSIENKSIPGASQEWLGLLALLAQVAQAFVDHTRALALLYESLPQRK